MQDADRTPEPHVRGGADVVWWGISGLLSLAALALPDYITTQPEITQRLAIAGAALFLTGALMGCFRRQRVWRWALAGLIAFVVHDIVVAVNGDMPLEATPILNLVAGNAQIYCIETLPIFLGASFGAWSLKGGWMSAE